MIHPSAIQKLQQIILLQILWKNFPIRDCYKLTKQKKPTILSGMVPVKETILSIAWNAIGTTSNMWDKLEKEPLTDSKVIFFYMKHTSYTTVARHLASQSNYLDPRMTTHILECIRLPKDTTRSHSIRDGRELVWIHRLNTNPQWP